VQVPPDVTCIHIVAAGTRTKQADFDVMPGQMSVLPMNGLPLGTVSFSGAAFPSACAAMTSTSQPTFVADPVVAQITSSAVTQVTLAMRRNGQASISVDFESAPMCVAAGGNCGDPTVPCCAGLTCQSEAGTLTCQSAPMCVGVGASCSAAMPCCAGLVCQGDATTGSQSCQSAPAPMCPTAQHVCLCATGFYCTGVDFLCISSSSPCP
jgi:hypothetical protein